MGRGALIARVVLAMGLLTAASWIEVPMVPVPMTLQSLALLTVAVWLGPPAVIAVIAWLAAAAVGLPVLSGMEGGITKFTGPTAGYLASFPLVAWGIGTAAARQWLDRPAPALGAMLLAHVGILALGWAWLQRSIGPGPAWEAGVAPFFLGMGLKSCAAAGFALYWRQRHSK